MFIWVRQKLSVLHIWKYFFRNLYRIFLLVVERETSMSTSFVPNIYEIIHKLCLVSAFPCIGNSDCPGIGASDGLFHKLNQRVLQHCKCYMDGFFFGWSFAYTVCCCYCDQLYKKYTENKCYAIAYIYMYLSKWPQCSSQKKKKKWPRCILVAIGRWSLGGRHVL